MQIRLFFTFSVARRLFVWSLVYGWSGCLWLLMALSAWPWNPIGYILWSRVGKWTVTNCIRNAVYQVKYVFKLWCSIECGYIPLNVYFMSVSTTETKRESIMCAKWKLWPQFQHFKKRSKSVKKRQKSKTNCPWSLTETIETQKLYFCIIFSFHSQQ